MSNIKENIYAKLFNRNKIISNKDIRQYKNKYRGQICIIVGNGPSLRIEDLDLLMKLGIKTIAANRIFLAFEKTSWRPDFYFISDEKIIDEETKQKIQEIPIYSRFFSEKLEGIAPCGIYYKNLMYRYGEEGKFSFDASKGVYAGGSITTEMIQFAYYFGFSEIYLIGVDFNYTFSNTINNKEYKYSNENNYFIEGYLKKDEIAAMPNTNANILAFNAAKEAISSKHRIIGNATRGGKLEVFTRFDLDSLFEKWKKNN